jgi:predicted 2-oxoglutarate/Fe(II)-dependent dioxygenase YbiX
LVLAFFGTAADAGGKAMIGITQKARQLFDDRKIVFFGVTTASEDQSRVAEVLPGIRYFWDLDGTVSRACGALAVNGQSDYRRFWVIVNPDLRVRAVIQAAGEDAGTNEIIAALEALPPVDAHSGFAVQAPILILPNVFGADECKRLIALHEGSGAVSSGFMRDVNGKTVEVQDRRHKSRSDYVITDMGLQQQIQTVFLRRVVPEIRKAYQFAATRMERYLVGCYDAESGGHFGAHRDNTTKGTAHRRFAVSVNLNDDFDGGEVSFPEYGRGGFKAPAGGAVVFSCSLLHAVSPIRRGKRYAFLPFLHDEAAARVRQANLQFIGGAAGIRAAG